MKIAIQGHPTRGHEVIQILESLGGENTHELCGNCKYSAHYYNIDSCGIIRFSPKDNLCNYKFYTLEEFEKEFSFKVGDTVITTYGRVGIISSFTPDNDEFPYCIVTKKGISFHPSSELKPYKEMDTRNITLTLEKAREWYNKGGELKEVALQAFTEKELTKVGLPKTWEEFCKQGNPIASWRYNISTKYEALHKLELLRDCYRGLFVTVIGMPVWCIKRWKGKLIIEQSVWGTNQIFLSFQSLKVAEEYLKNFKPLIKQAGDLI